MARLFSNTNFDALVKTDTRKFVIVTNAGGPGIIATDAMETYGCEMGWPSDEIKDKLRKALPSEASVKNPIDVIGDAPPKRYADATDICFQDPNIHGALILVTP